MSTLSVSSQFIKVFIINENKGRGGGGNICKPLVIYKKMFIYKYLNFMKDKTL